MQTEDRRIRKTKKAMNSALAELLSQKPLNNISVREIAELADINRGTFYLHYRDVYDMVDKLQNDIFERFYKIVEEYELKTRDDSLFPLVVNVFDFLEENAELTRVLIGKNGDAAFVDKLKNILWKTCFANAKKIFEIKDQTKFNYFYHYIVTGCIGICDAWLNSGMKESSAEMAALVEKLIINSIQVLT